MKVTAGYGLATACLVVAMSGAPTPFSAQSADNTATYRQLVDAYRGAHHADDAAIARAGEAALPLEFGTGATAGWPPVELAAAAMLHTDACLRLIKAERPEDAAAHLDRAIAWLQTAVDRDPGRAEYARRWRDVVSGLLEAFGAVPMSATVRARVTAWLPQSQEQAAARAAFEKGVTAEIQAAAAGPLSGPPPKVTHAVPPEALSELRAAARQYELAISLDPSDLEVALHLGRVRALEAFDEDAARWLGRAAGSPSPGVKYLALLYLGAIAERQGRLADAEAAYRSAIETFTWGQSAPMALSHVLMRAGREVEAREALVALLSRTREPAVEPLWTYLADPEADLRPSLDELRAEVWR